MRITADGDAEGEPVVSNDVALCKLHHAAFDRFFFAIRPDSVIEVRPSVLRESDGPMLVVGLQQIHLPRRTVDLPDRGATRAPLALSQSFDSVALLLGALRQ